MFRTKKDRIIQKAQFCRRARKRRRGQQNPSQMKRGRKKERRAVRILTEMMQRGLFEGIVIDVVQTESCGSEDYSGIDVWLRTPEYLPDIPIQIKSRGCDAKEFSISHPDICVLVVPIRTSDEALIDKFYHQMVIFFASRLDKAR